MPNCSHDEQDAIMRAKRELILYARRLGHHHLVMGHGGNMSARIGNAIIITKHGVHIESLSEEDLVIIPLSGGGDMEYLASVELPVHRAIYLKTSSRAIIHTHSPYVAALAQVVRRYFKPVDEESRRAIPLVPVVEAPPGTMELAKRVSRRAEEGFKVILVKGHGVFVHGDSIREAYTLACLIEHAARTWLLSIHGGFHL